MCSFQLLWTEGPEINSNAVELNFLESLISFIADFSADGCQIDEENGIVEDKQSKGQHTTDNLSCESIDYESDLQNRPLSSQQSRIPQARKKHFSYSASPTRSHVI
jgi:hypothetical protein